MAMYTCELSKVRTGWKAEFRANQGYSLGYAVRLPSLCSPPQTSQATLPPTHAKSKKCRQTPVSGGGSLHLVLFKPLGHPSVSALGTLAS